MSILKELPELVEAGVISEESAERIREHYRKKGRSSRNWAPITFGILGALLVGLGAILIVAQNWNELSRSMRAAIAFLPLLTAQALAAYVIFKKEGQRIWTESVGIFLILGLGASLSLIAQTYHLQGSLPDFLFTWMLLAVPVPYLLRSPSSSLLYLLGITYYAHSFNFENLQEVSSWYGLLFILILPYLVHLYRSIPRSNFANVHNWVVPLSLAYGCTSLFAGNEKLLMPGMAALFGAFFLLGQDPFFLERGGVRNGFRRLGQLGTLILLFFASFDLYWTDLESAYLFEHHWTESPGLYTWAVLFATALGLGYSRVLKLPFRAFDPFEGAWVFVALLVPVGLLSEEILPAVLINLYIVYIAIHRMLIGAKRASLSSVNLGASVFAVWVLCRFFELDLSFLWRGIIFIVLGLGFFILNYRLLQKQKGLE